MESCLEKRAHCGRHPYVMRYLRPSPPTAVGFAKFHQLHQRLISQMRRPHDAVLAIGEIAEDGLQRLPEHRAEMPDQTASAVRGA